MACLFCDIASKKEPASVFYEDGRFVAFLDKYPIDEGHSLVIPKAHYERLTDMTEEEAGSLFAAVRKVAPAVLRSTGAAGFSLGQNNGKEARQIIGHVHVHIIPRYAKRGTVWTKRQIGQRAGLDEAAGRIRAEL